MLKLELATTSIPLVIIYAKPLPVKKREGRLTEMKGSWSQAIMAVLADWFAVISYNASKNGDLTYSCSIALTKEDKSELLLI